MRMSKVATARKTFVDAPATQIETERERERQGDSGRAMRTLSLLALPAHVLAILHSLLFSARS